MTDIAPSAGRWLTDIYACLLIAISVDRVDARAPPVRSRPGAPSTSPGIQISPPRRPGRRAAVERDGELAWIDSTIHRAGRQGGILVFEGPTGIGETPAVAERQRAAGAAGVGPLRPARRTRARLSVRHRPPWLEPRSRAASEEISARRCSTVRRRLHPPALTQAETSPVRVESALHSLYWLIANLSERSPLLLLLDDAQWADERRFDC